MEYGFADSTGDDVSVLKNNWQDLSEAVVRALAGYIGVPYKAPVGGGTTANYYTVKSGDTLWKIANSNQVTVDEIKKANNLSSNALSIGQVLLIPSKTSSTTPSSDNTYTVQSGDSLWKIANKYQTTVAELRRINNLKSDVLQIGQKLKLPGSSSSNNNGITYTVVSGDSLYKIANQYGLSVNDIMKANNLTSSNLSIGQKLIIPSKENNQIYTVVSGDSLYRIAQKFDTSVKAIQDLNNLSSTNLSIGQKLLIPNS